MKLNIRRKITKPIIKKSSFDKSPNEPNGTKRISGNKSVLPNLEESNKQTSNEQSIKLSSDVAVSHHIPNLFLDLVLVEDKPKYPLPKFVKEKYNINEFLIGIENTLKEWINNIPHLTTNPLSTSSFNQSICRVLRDINVCRYYYDQLCLNFIENIKPDVTNEQGKLFNLKKIDYTRVIDYVSNHEQELNFNNNKSLIKKVDYCVRKIASTLLELCQDIERCSYGFVSNGMEERGLQLQKMNFMEFITLKRCTYDNIDKAINDYIDLKNYDLSRGYDKSILMPGVFFEYFIYHDFTFSNDQHFHFYDGNCIPSFQTKLRDIEGIQIPYEICCKQEVLNNKKTCKYIVINNEKIKYFYPHVEMNISNTGVFIVSNCESGKSKKSVEYHRKELGNSSDGFWINFEDSGKKFYFKELFCVSDRFKHEEQDIQFIYKSQSTYRNDYYKFIDRNQSLSNKKSYSKIGLYHCNEYAELSGYMLLDLFGMIPQFDTFYSNFIEKPIVVVEEIDRNQFTLVSSLSISDSGEEVETRFDFNLINNNPYSMFMSAIPIQSLRLIQLIFLVDDFHEGNLAVSVVKQDFNGNPIEYIDRIQAIDLWPSRYNLNENYLLSCYAKIENVTDYSFDDIILSRLDNPDNSLVFQDSVGTQIEADPNNDQHQKILNMPIDLIGNNKKTIYGDRIISQNMDPVLRRAYIALYAMIDLFDTVYFNKHDDIFKSMNGKQSNLCANIVLILLKKTYYEITEGKCVLPNIFENIQNCELEDFEDIKRNGNMNNDWKSYMNNAVKMTMSILKKFEVFQIYSFLSIPNKLFRIDFQENDIKFTSIDDGKDIHRILGSNSFGFAFSYELEPTKEQMLQLFNLPGKAEERNLALNAYCDIYLKGHNNANTSIPILYFTTSPTLFDIIHQNSSALFNKVENGKVTIKCLFKTS